MSAWWYETPFPKVARGKDLLKYKLVLDPDRPPEDTQFAGMKNVFVKVVNRKEPSKWVVYKVMMTERDITTAIDCMERKKIFTFDDNNGKDKFASVVIDES